MKTPWHDKDGNLQFPYRAIFDRAFIFPTPLPERYESEYSMFEIPKMYRKYYKSDSGILLSVGPGYYEDSGKWHPTSDQLSPGCKVMYDKTVPWGITVPGLDGKEYAIVMCGYLDVRGVL